MVDVVELFDVTGEPDGGVPLAFAVLLTDPAFTSAWLMIRVAVHVVDAPGVRIVSEQLIDDRPGNGSTMAIAVSITLPVLVTKNEKVCVSPSDGPVGVVSVVSVTDLDSESVLIWLIGVAVDDGFDVVANPFGGLALAVAVLSTDPALTSAWVIVRVAEHVVERPGARMVSGQLIDDMPVNGSVTATALTVTLPVLVTKNEKVCVSPSDAPTGAVSVVRATLLVNVIVLV